MNCKYPDNNFGQESMNSRRCDDDSRRFDDDSRRFCSDDSRRFDPDCVNCGESRKFCRTNRRRSLSPVPHPVLFDVAKNDGPVMIDRSCFRPTTLVTLRRFDVCCLKFPFVKLDFNSLLHFKLRGSDYESKTSKFTITFDIVKVCNNVFNNDSEVIDTFSVTQAARLDKDDFIKLDIPVTHTTIDINTNNSFDCCRASYRVVVSKISHQGDVCDITLRNSSLAALAKSNC